jgi:hypothetical protein
LKKTIPDMEENMLGTTNKSFCDCKHETFRLKMVSPPKSNRLDERYATMLVQPFNHLPASAFSPPKWASLVYLSR